MDSDEAQRSAEQFLSMNPPGVSDAVLVGIEEYPQAFVAYWTTARHRASKDVADAQGPGIGPLAVPKDGGALRYLGSQRLDVELHRAGLAPEPGNDPEGSWGF